MVSIPLSHARSQRSLKLLELPPDLLEQLLHAPETPPTGGRSSSTLYLKAPPAPSATDPPSARTPASDNFVNLCTHDRTWHLQQVNSSNSLLILQAGSECTGHHNGHRSSGGLSSIAQCNATLEAVPPPLAKRSAEPFLHRRVHVYDGKNKNNDPAHPTVTGSEVQRTIEALFSDIPLSQADCERQWVESCCFVDHDPSSAAGELVCWRPSVSVKLDAWRKLLEVSILRDIDVKKQFLVSDLWNAVVDEEDGTPFPKAVFDAIVRRVMPSWQQSSSFTSTLECEFCFSFEASSYSPTAARDHH